MSSFLDTLSELPEDMFPEFGKVFDQYGEIKEVQRLSRRISGGQVTISQRLAQVVAVGRISMEEAIGRHLQRLSY